MSNVNYIRKLFPQEILIHYIKNENIQKISYKVKGILLELYTNLYVNVPPHSFHLIESTKDMSNNVVEHNEEN